MRTYTPIKRHPDHGQVSWVHRDSDKYVVTGVLRSGHRFGPLVYSGWTQANAINLWRGSRWLLRDGKRYLISRVYN